MANIQENGRIYEIGTYQHYEGIPSEKIFILHWKGANIPFIVCIPVKITETKDQAGYCRLSIVSIVVRDVGMNLLKLPSGRCGAHYNKSYFEGMDKHEFIFRDVGEYQQICEAIKAELIYYLYNNHKDPSQLTLLPAEIIFTFGPWNLYSGPWGTDRTFFQRQHDEQQNRHESVYRWMSEIEFCLDSARARKNEYYSKLEHSKSAAKIYANVFKNSLNALMASHASAEDLYKKYVRLFKKEARNLDGFIAFIKFRIKTPLPYGAMFRIGDVYIREDAQTLFFAWLVESRHPVLVEFNQYADRLKQEAIRQAEEYLLHVRKRL